MKDFAIPTLRKGILYKLGLLLLHAKAIHKILFQRELYVQPLPLYYTRVSSYEHLYLLLGVYKPVVVHCIMNVRH